MIEAGKITVKLALDSEQFERDARALTQQQIPTIGRTVHYQSLGSTGGEYLPAPRAAIITAVHDDQPVPEHGVAYVDLAVLNPTGMFFNTHVLYSAEPKPGCWSWPPRA